VGGTEKEKEEKGSNTRGVKEGRPRGGGGEEEGSRGGGRRESGTYFSDILVGLYWLLNQGRLEANPRMPEGIVHVDAILWV
jgi:hypothetical protein